MQVEIWADFACPFCYIGKRRFEKALEQFEHRDRVQVLYRSFELDPKAPIHVSHDVYDMLSSRYGMSRDQAIAMNQPLFRQAADEGLHFQYEGLVLTNTFDAHRLRHFAEAYNKSAVLSELLFRAYFSETKNVSDHATLADLAVQAGLDRGETLTMLAGKQFAEQVHKDEEEGRSLGISGVPFYVIDRKRALSGAQPVSLYLEALQQAWNDQQLLQISEAPSGDVCMDDSCAITDKS